MTKAVIDPIYFPGVERGSAIRQEATMIFRHFLDPRTGCASYLFG
jgi:hypothetical protein